MDSKRYNQFQIYFHSALIIFSFGILYAYTQTYEFGFILLGCIILINSLFRFVKVYRQMKREQKENEEAKGS
ncbi:hypothetical protein [Salirhabdus sp. Marseille-P4669]|uniref:hypothetical protein n=1 Tax=Salirhabdus sp. Marseille-P4669 TaxID=2042310 RepID=UPI000C7AEC0F|nr:hypothetical protein [Salirhabdus sp. Marseille-P4669]